MNMHWPQITILTLTALSLFVFALNDGKPRTGNHSFAIQMCASGINIWILWCGGFFA